MPPPPVIFGPIAAAAAAKSAHAAHVAKHVALHHSVPVLSSASIAAILAREGWKRIPDWIKNDPAFRNYMRSSSSAGADVSDDSGGEQLIVDPDEMASISAILEKLQGLAESGYAKLETSLNQREIHAAVLAYIQLALQLQARRPEVRDCMYDCAGTPYTGNSMTGNDWMYQIGIGGSTISETTTTRENKMEQGQEEKKKEHDQEREDICDVLQEALDFAVWAYDVEADVLRTKLEELDYFLLNLHVATKPGQVGHFIAISPERRKMIIGVKGTSSLEDLLTDCCGRAVTYELKSSDCDDGSVEVRNCEEIYVDDGSVEVHSHEGVFVDEGTLKVRCHEGILISSKKLANEVQPFVEHLAVRCGYSIRICGHSLGAGAACLLSVILRARIPYLVEKDRIRVFAFASPPVLDIDAAVACAPYTIAVVNNSDIIPRSSMANLSVFLEFLKIVNDKLRERGMGFDGTRSAMALLRKLSQGTGGDLLMSLEECREVLTEAHDTVQLRDPDHLYVPGRVLIMYEHWDRQRHNDDKGDSPSTTDCDGTAAHVRGIWSYGTASVLRQFEIDMFRTVTDHLTSSYYAGIEALRMEAHV